MNGTDKIKPTVGTFNMSPVGLPAPTLHVRVSARHGAYKQVMNNKRYMLHAVWRPSWEATTNFVIGYRDATQKFIDHSQVNLTAISYEDPQSFYAHYINPTRRAYK